MDSTSEILELTDEPAVYLPTTEAARILGLSLSEFYIGCRTGTYRFFVEREGGRWKVHAAKLARYLRGESEQTEAISAMLGVLTQLAVGLSEGLEITIRLQPVRKDGIRRLRNA